MNCPNCEEKISDTSVFCSFCGAKLVECVQSNTPLSGVVKVLILPVSILCPLFFFVAAICYYSLRRKYPKKATQLLFYSLFSSLLGLVLYLWIAYGPLPEAKKQLIEQEKTTVVLAEEGKTEKASSSLDDDFGLMDLFNISSTEETGDASAQFLLGLCYADGVKKSEEKAFRYFRMAAEKGYSPAQAALAVAYSEGAGVKEDDKAAFQWLCKAVEQGDAVGQYLLGMLYMAGEQGVPKDEAKAQSLFLKSAEQGNACGQFSLGMCYLRGIGVEKDEKLGMELIHKAAERKLSAAIEYLEIVKKQASAK